MDSVMSPSITDKPNEGLSSNDAVKSCIPDCRLCAQKSPDFIEIFSDAGAVKDLPFTVKFCAPVLITDDDELPKTVCTECCNKLHMVRGFFETCINANQELIVRLRKSSSSPLDLYSHINQYVRSFNAPIVPNIKVEPSNYLDVNIGEVDNDEIESIGDFVSESEEAESCDEVQSDDDESHLFNGNGSYSLDESLQMIESLENEDGSFKVPKAPGMQKRGRPKRCFKDRVISHKTNGNTGSLDGAICERNTSVRGRKKAVPMALKICSDCNKVFDDHDSNLSHWKTDHPEKEVVYRCLEEDTSIDEQCPFESTVVSEVFKHQSRHKTKDTNSKEKLFDCKICGKHFTLVSMIARHSATHVEDGELRCCICSKELSSVKELNIHVKTHDSDEQKYTHCCELCGKRFTQRANLEAHLRIHSGFKPFACDHCGKSFSQKGNMEEHRRVHTGERPFVCELCGTSFVRRSEMALHTRIAHTGERPYQCNFCSKSFQRRDLLRKHERIHTDTRPYACQFCGKTFTQRDKMVVHTRLHTGERPYVCDVCGKGFCESGNLKKHMRVHGKEPPPVMHQNNKGKPAPAQPAPGNFSVKYNQNMNNRQEFQGQINREEDSSNHGVPDESTSPLPPPNNATSVSNHLHHNTQSINHGLTSNNLPFNLKLEQQAAVGQYPLSSVAVAAAAAAAANLAHSQMTNQHHPLMGAHHHQNHHLTRSTNATPIHELDNHSDACSERSVTSPAMAPTSVTPSPLQHMHHQQAAFPYPVHQTLLQQLNDWYGGHLPSSNAHNH